jgi:hypothetical protein
MTRAEVSLHKEKIYLKHFKGNSSIELFKSAWAEYIGYLRGAIDDPDDESDIVNWIEQIISAKVNNPKSKFYIYG